MDNHWTYTNSFLLNSAMLISDRLPPSTKNLWANFCSVGVGSRPSASFQAVFTAQERFCLHSDASRPANARDCSCMKSLFIRVRACNACVLTGRTGHDVTESGWSNEVSRGRRTLRLL